MDRFYRWLLAAMLVFGPAGCQSLSGPNWFHPGTARCQQLRAQQYDPYPQSDAGPPIVGARPQGFENPPPEVQRVRPNDLRARWFPPCQPSPESVPSPAAAANSQR